MLSLNRAQFHADCPGIQSPQSLNSWKNCAAFAWMEAKWLSLRTRETIQRQPTRTNAANFKRHYPTRTRGDWGSVALSRSEPETEFAKHYFCRSSHPGSDVLSGSIQTASRNGENNSCDGRRFYNGCLGVPRERIPQFRDYITRSVPT